MPEGDTIYRTATRLRQVVGGKRVDAARARGRDHTLSADSLVGRIISATEARGKHLLIHFDDELTLHSHLGMNGAWHVYSPGEGWQKPDRWAAVVIEVPDCVCVCFSPKTLELLTETQLRRHPHISRLGPDLLADTLDHAEILRRFRVHDPTPIGQAVMNQTIVCGIGNIYKSEILFLRGIDPSIPVAQLSDEEIVEIVKLASDLMSKNLQGYPRRTRFALDRHNHWVYGRNGKACFKCGTRIQLSRQGDLGRTTFWCSKCQQS